MRDAVILASLVSYYQAVYYHDCYDKNIPKTFNFLRVDHNFELKFLIGNNFYFTDKCLAGSHDLMIFCGIPIIDKLGHIGNIRIKCSPRKCLCEICISMQTQIVIFK